MKRLMFPLFILTFFLFSCSGHNAQVQKHRGARVSQVILDDMIVYAVEDSSGQQDISLYNGPLSEAERKQYMPGGKSPSSVNIFVIKKDNRIIMVDAGWGPDGRTRGKAMDELAKVGITAGMIDYVILTHMHGDHISGLLVDGRAAFPKARVMVSRAESSFWLAPSTLRNETFNGNAQLAQAVARAYSGRFQEFGFGQPLFPGILALDASGHTPGHTAFLLGTEGRDRMIIAGDFLHSAALQFAHPEESARYDMDPAKAVATRRALMERAAREDIIIAGMHIPFSGWGKVTKENGGFEFHPLK